jgi:Salmonella virulence plasmid 65kDa B protein
MTSRTLRYLMGLVVLMPVLALSGLPKNARVADSPSPASAGGGPVTPVMAGDASTFGESPPPEVTDDGRFEQRIPVQVPSFHGLEPSVALVYDSREGDGIAGRGWRLSGDSFVRRFSHSRGAPRMDRSDDFLLDDERLIRCSQQRVKGISCMTGGTHSTERETFRRITRTGSSWLVWDRDGTRSEYVSWPGKAQNVIFGIAERRNTHGDLVKFHRWCDGNDACYLREIEYQDAADPAMRTRIELHYEERPDPIRFGMGTSMLFTRFRLLTIEVQAGGGKRGALGLHYASAPGSLAAPESQLDGVTRYGNDVLYYADSWYKGNLRISLTYFEGGVGHIPAPRR